MLFSKEDLKIASVEDLLEFLPIIVFVGFVAPFLITAYSIGFFMDITGWSKTST